MSRTRKAIGGLALVGVAVAAYLTWVHYAGAEPLCVAGGGACEKVQTSDQSELLGLPVAVLGLGAYIALFASALTRGEIARIGGAFVAVAGVAFSAYLTYAELFIIEAICQWCVLSALLMVALGVLCARRVLVEP